MAGHLKQEIKDLKSDSKKLLEALRGYVEGLGEDYGLRIGEFVDTSSFAQEITMVADENERAVYFTDKAAEMFKGLSEGKVISKAINFHEGRKGKNERERFVRFYRGEEILEEGIGIVRPDGKPVILQPLRYDFHFTINRELANMLGYDESGFSRKYTLVCFTLTRGLVRKLVERVKEQLEKVSSPNKILEGLEEILRKFELKLEDTTEPEINPA